jgi:hypothetical protein
VKPTPPQNNRVFLYVLFGGLGGVTFGARQFAAEYGVDVTVVLSVDGCDRMNAIYRLNHDSDAFTMTLGPGCDVEMIEGIIAGKMETEPDAIHILQASPPCQGLSRANRSNNDSDVRASNRSNAKKMILWVNDFFVRNGFNELLVENVPHEMLNAVCDDCDMSCMRVQGAEFGYPCRRERLLMHKHNPASRSTCPDFIANMALYRDGSPHRLPIDVLPHLKGALLQTACGKGLKTTLDIIAPCIVSSNPLWVYDGATKRRMRPCDTLALMDMGGCILLPDDGNRKFNHRAVGQVFPPALVRACLFAILGGKKIKGK